MPMKRRFYHVNGQMMAYEEDGVTKDFLTDHLGSITAEIDQNQNRTFEARYSAYGIQNWSTGTGCGFGWVGSYGYRETGLFHMSHYVRARHYSYVTGNWSTVDPLWPQESAYGYVNGRATTDMDPTGMSCYPSEFKECWIRGFGGCVETFGTRQVFCFLVRYRIALCTGSNRGRDYRNCRSLQAGCYAAVKLRPRGWDVRQWLKFCNECYWKCQRSGIIGAISNGCDFWNVK